MFSSGGPSVRFLTRYDGEVTEPLVVRHRVWGGRVVGESCSWLKVDAERVSLRSESPRLRPPFVQPVPALLSPE